MNNKYVYELLEEGHYVSIVTNATVSKRFEELEATLQRKDINEIKLDEAAADLDLVSSVHKQVVEEQWKNNTKESISSKLNIIIDLSNKVRYNVNVNLILDKLVISLAEV